MWNKSGNNDFKALLRMFGEVEVVRKNFELLRRVRHRDDDTFVHEKNLGVAVVVVAHEHDGQDLGSPEAGLAWIIGEACKSGL